MHRMQQDLWPFGGRSRGGKRKEEDRKKGREGRRER